MRERDTESETGTDVRGSTGLATSWHCQQWKGSLICRGQKAHRKKLSDTNA